MLERGRGYKTTPVSSILCLSQIRMEANPWRKAFLRASGLTCSMAFFWSFPSDRRFPHCRQQSSPMIILWEKLWQCGRINVIGWKEWYRKKNIDFESYLLIKLQSLFKFSTIFFEKCIKKTPTEKCTFPTTKNILYLFILIVSDLVFIYFRDSTYNFRLWHLVLDYKTENFKLDFN